MSDQLSKYDEARALRAALDKVLWPNVDPNEVTSICV